MKEREHVCLFFRVCVSTHPPPLRLATANTPPKFCMKMTLLVLK